jgi:hypothetical protein
MLVALVTDSNFISVSGILYTKFCLETLCKFKINHVVPKCKIIGKKLTVTEY